MQKWRLKWKKLRLLMEIDLKYKFKYKTKILEIKHYRQTLIKKNILSIFITKIFLYQIKKLFKMLILLILKNK